MPAPHVEARPVRRELSDLAGVVVSVGIAGVLTVLYSAVVASKLGPEAYSDVPAAIAIATLLAVAFGALAPITAHLSARYAAAHEPEKIRGLVGLLLRVILGIGAIGFLVCLFAAAPVAALLRIRTPATVTVAYATFIVLASAAVVRSAVRGAQRFRRYSAELIAESALRLGFGVALLYFAPTAAVAVAAYALATAIVGVDAWSVIRKLSGTVVRPASSEVTLMIGPTALLMVIMAVFQNLDLLIVKHYFVRSDAGMYGAAITLARAMLMIGMPFEALLLPRLSYLLERGQPVRGPLVRLAAGLALAASAPLLIFAFAPGLVIDVIFGQAFERSAPLLLPLAAGLFLLFVSYIATQALITVGAKKAPLLFIGMIAVEALLLVRMHDSLHQVATIVVSTRSALFVILAASLLLRWRAGRIRS